MKISGYGSINSTGNIKKRGGTTEAGNFADLLGAAETGEATAPAPVTDIAAAALSNLLSLQEISEEEIQRKKLLQRGNTLLDSLEDIRRQLLTGTLPPHLIRQLSRQLSVEKQFVTDPALNQIIEDIELRAAVELAKLEMAMARNAALPEDGV